MDYQAILIFVLCGIGALALIVLLERWYQARFLSRFMTKSIKWLNQPGPPARNSPESLYVVELSDSAVECRNPNGTVERVEWLDLQRVEVMMTNEGPFLPDAFWILHGSATGCVIPWGATGDRELLSRLQALPNFDNMAVINAMPSAEDHRFLCWQRAK